MPRLLVNPNSPTAWEIHLKPGANFIGRGFANDFKIPDPSVSGSHCQIVVSDHSAVLKDLESTNGTYVNRAPVKEVPLQNGQTIHLGAVEIVYYTDAAPGLAVGAPPPPRTAAPPPPHAIRAPVAAAPVLRAAAPTAVAAPPPAAVLVAPIPNAVTASGPCKHHPKTPGRFRCPKCNLFYCELCVTSRNVGSVQHKFCRQCGTQCIPVRVQVARPSSGKGFFSRLPGAFVYPFRGSGLLVLIIATIIFALLNAISGGIAIFASMAALGYLFSYMQNIIHCTASEDDEMASLPGFDGLFGAFLTLAGTVLVSFGLPIGLAVAKFFFDVEGISTSALIATTVLGCLYFPMAFLAVAMKDSVMAANPLVVIPAIFKVPVGYLATAFVVVAVFGVRQLGDIGMFVAKSEGYATKEMSTLFITFGLRMFWSFLSVYLLTVSMRILGLLYVTNKHKFGWFSR